MQRILELAKKKSESAEVFRIERHSEPACFMGGKLNSMESENSISTGLRVVVDGKLGFSSTTHPEEVEGLVDRAIASAVFGPPITLAFPNHVQAFGQGVHYDKKVANLTSQDLIETGQEMISIVQKSFPDVNLEVEVSKGIDDVSIINSNGGQVSYSKTAYQAFLNVLLMMPSDRAELEHTFTSSQFSDGPLQISQDAVWRFSHCGRVAPVQTKRMTVLFTSLGFRGLFVPFFYGFNGDLIARKLSLLSGKLGESIVSPEISVYDDPTKPGLPGSCPVDDEGVPTQKLVLIENGVLKNYLFDLRSAGQTGGNSTGHGFKKSSLYTGFSIDAQPNPTPSNFIIPGGSLTRDELIRSIDEGIIVDDTMGAGQGNNLNGEFSMNVALGYKIEKGEIVGRVKDVMVAGNIFEILKNNVGQCSRETWAEDTLFGRYEVPWIAFENMPVSAT